jgi:hypothetical protein
MWIPSAVLILLCVYRRTDSQTDRQTELAHTIDIDLQNTVAKAPKIMKPLSWNMAFLDNVCLKQATIISSTVVSIRPYNYLYLISLDNKWIHLLVASLNNPQTNNFRQYAGVLRNVAFCASHLLVRQPVSVIAFIWEEQLVLPPLYRVNRQFRAGSTFHISDAK